MARARNIKPGFFRNEILAELPPITRLLFAGLWTIADKAGRMEDRPKRIKADVLPYDDGDVDAMLDQLASAGFIARYNTGDARYIEVLNFGKHQNPHVKEQESTIPAPPNSAQHSTSTVQEPDKPDASFPLTDSLNPLTDSPIPQSDAPGKPVQEDGDGPEPTIHDQRFESFWLAYPRKTGKEAARKWWMGKKPSAAFHAKILTAIDDQKVSVQWLKDDGQYIPNPATWLNQGRWDDELPKSNGLTIHAGGRSGPYSGKVGKDGRTDEERGWRENPGHKGWSADEMMRIAMAEERRGT